MSGINKIKDMIRKVGWVPQKGILYVIPTPEHAEKCVNSFLEYDFSKVVSKVSACMHLIKGGVNGGVTKNSTFNKICNILKPTKQICTKTFETKIWVF